MKQILLIEDNADVHENTAEILELAGYEVSTAENGKVGASLAVTGNFDIIICDIMMPVLYRSGVLHILNKNQKTSTIPLIFLTAKSEKKDFRKGMNLGADDYLTKPFEETELLEVIERRLEKSDKLKSTQAKNPIDFIDTVDKGVNLTELITEKNTRHFKKKETIYREGEYPNALYYIKSGKVKLSRISDYGKEFITSICSEGEFIGYLALFENTTFQEEAITIEDSEVVTISFDEFQKLLHSNREVSNNFIRLLSRNALDQEDRLLNLAYGNVRERVAYVLNHIYEKHGTSSLYIGLSISRDELAGYTGIATESLIRTLSELKADGVLATDGRNLQILDADKLKRIANGQPA